MRSGVYMVFPKFTGFIAHSLSRFRSMCYQPHIFGNLEMSAAASDDEFMYDCSCISERGGCGQRRVVRYLGCKAARTRGERSEEKGARKVSCIAILREVPVYTRTDFIANGGTFQIPKEKTGSSEAYEIEASAPSGQI